MAAAPPPAPPLQPALDLQRSLLLRGVWLAGLLLLALLLAEGELQRRAAIAALPGNARLVAQLLNEQLGRASESFDRADLNLDLGALDGLAERLPLCLDVRSVHERLLARRCDPPAAVGATGRWLGARLRVERLIAEAVAAGARPLLDGRGLAVPGCPDGQFLGPTVLAGGRGLPRTAIHGPVLQVLEVPSLDAAIERLNAGADAALAGVCLHTGSRAAAQRFADTIAAGQVGINAALPAAVPLAIDDPHGALPPCIAAALAFCTRAGSIAEHWPA